MIRLFDEFAEPGLQIIAIFQSPPALMAEYVGKQNPPFPLISDLGHKVYKAFHQNHISFDRIFNFASCGINSAQLNEKGFL